MSERESMTILMHFHQSHYRDFKAYYLCYVLTYWHAEVPRLVSYPRFVALIPSVLVPLCAYLEPCRGDWSGRSFVDSTPIAVCHHPRITRHRVFAGLAQRGKHSVGWFYGFKRPVIVNDQGKVLASRLTAGTVDDRQPVPQMARGISGKRFGDQGYLSEPLVEDLLEQGLHVVTPVRKTRGNRLLLLADKLFLRKRAILETIHDQLKNISQIDHSPHRSWANFLVNVVAGVIASCHQPKQPSLRLVSKQLASGWA